MCVIDQPLGQDGWILDKFSFAYVMEKGKMDKDNNHPSWPNKVGQ